MSDPTLTLTLPPAVRDELARRAHAHHRLVEDEATLTLTAAVRADDALPSEVEAALAALETLDEEALRRVSHSQPTIEDGVLLDALVDTRRRGGLTPDEDGPRAELIDRHDRVMVLRAEAVALLWQRGCDVRERVARA